MRDCPPRFQGTVDHQQGLCCAPLSASAVVAMTLSEGRRNRRGSLHVVSLAVVAAAAALVPLHTRAHADAPRSVPVRTVSGAAQPASAPATSPVAIRAALESGVAHITTRLLDQTTHVAQCDYHWLEGAWEAYEPAWHTGQAIYGLLAARRVLGDDFPAGSSILATAKGAGDWWTSLAMASPPALRGMVNATGSVPPWIVFSTVSDGSHALFMLSNATGDDTYANTAASAAAWLLDNTACTTEPWYYDNVNPFTGAVLKHSSPFWPGVQNPPLHYVARPNAEGSLFLDAARWHSDAHGRAGAAVSAVSRAAGVGSGSTSRAARGGDGGPFMAAFLAQCDGMVAAQDRTGLWMQFTPNDAANNWFHPRFNLWYAEALLDGAELTGNASYAAAAARTLATYALAQQPDGTIYYGNTAVVSNTTHKVEVTPIHDSVCGSAVAFATVLWLRLATSFGHAEFADNAAAGTAWLAVNRFDDNHPDPNLRGATLETQVHHHSSGLDVKYRGIATSFAMRALSDVAVFCGGTGRQGTSSDAVVEVLCGTRRARTDGV